MKMYMVQIGWSVTDQTNYLIKANSFAEAKATVLQKFGSVQILATYEIESEIFS
jgi:hypothetical protein